MKLKFIPIFLFIGLSLSYSSPCSVFKKNHLAPFSQLSNKSLVVEIQHEKLVKKVLETLPEEIYSILNKISEQGFDVWIFGGAIRDIAMGRPPKDWDIEINGTNKDIQKFFPNATYMSAWEGWFIDKISLKNGGYALLDIVSSEAAFLADGLHKRAGNVATFNLVKVNVGKKKVFDPLGGLQDLYSRLIELPSNRHLILQSLFRTSKTYIDFETEFGGFKIGESTRDRLYRFSENYDFSEFFGSEQNWETLLSLFESFSIAPRMVLELWNEIGVLDKLYFPDLKNFSINELLKIAAELQDIPRTKRLKVFLEKLPDNLSALTRERLSEYRLPPERIPYFKEGFIDFLKEASLLDFSREMYKKSKSKLLAIAA